MPFSPEQLGQLTAPLSATNVKERDQAGRKLSYIEGWHAIAEANRIFGFDAWDRELACIKQLGEPREVNGKWRVAYMATVRIKVRAGSSSDLILRDGTGYGSGIDRDMGQAHESAIKEAETDAMKRALMTFGNPFGLALYDKTQANVVDEPPTAPETRPREPAPPAPPAGNLSQRATVTERPRVTSGLPKKTPRETYLGIAEGLIAQPDRSATDLIEWWRADSENRHKAGLTQDDVDALKGKLTARLNTIYEKDAA